MNKEIYTLMTIRAPKEEDRSFIMATWLRGLYYGNPWFKEIEKDNFMAKYHDIISRMLTKPTAQVYVAVLKDDLDVILGYSVTEPKIIHWVFVKEAWRKMGIATALVPKDADTATHLTMLGKKLKPQSMEFNPFLI